MNDDPFAAYTAAEALKDFQCVKQPPNYLFLYGMSTSSNMRFSLISMHYLLGLE